MLGARAGSSRVCAPCGGSWSGMSSPAPRGGICGGARRYVHAVQPNSGLVRRDMQLCAANRTASPALLALLRKREEPRGTLLKHTVQSCKVLYILAPCSKASPRTPAAEPLQSRLPSFEELVQCLSQLLQRRMQCMHEHHCHFCHARKNVTRLR